MRAVAVLLVVAGHAGVPFLAGGYVGVDVFFVISGFLITSLLLKELGQTGRISIRGFYARRAARLLPASSLVLAATLLAAWLWLPATRIGSITADAVASSFYSINYRLAITGTSYFNADAPPSPMQHFWSLAVEEQFYLVWPLLLLGTTLAWRGRGQIRRTQVAMVLALILAGSLALSITQSTTSASWAYFGIHTRAWELATGAMVAVFAVNARKLAPVPATVLTWTGIAMIVTAGVTFDESTVFPGYAAALPVIGTGLTIAGGCAAPGYGARLLLDRRPFQFVGKLSYGLYLWHWPILLIAPVAFGRTPSLSFNLAAMLGALLVTWVTFHLVENPVRTRRSLRLRPWRGIGLGAALTAGTATLALLTAVVVPLTMYSGRTATDTAAVMSAPDAGLDDLQRLIVKSQQNMVVPANLSPPLQEAEDDLPKLYHDGCSLSLTDDVTRNRICEYGDTTSDTTVVLYGDSHAAQWFPALDRIAHDRGWRLVPLTRSGCPPAMVDIVHHKLGRRYTECTEWRRHAFDIVKDLKPALVVTTAVNGHRPVDENDEPLDKPDAALRDGWQATFTTLQDLGAKVVYLIDTPNFRQVVVDCVATNLRATDDCAIGQKRAMLRPERTEMIVEMARDRDVTVIDPIGWFCAREVCPAIVGNILVVRDTSHVTTPYIRAIAPLLAEQLPRL